MDTNNTVKSQNQPAKKKHGPIYYIITVIGWIFGILVIGGLVYNNFFNNQQTDDWDEKLQAIRKENHELNIKLARIEKLLEEQSNKN